MTKQAEVVPAEAKQWNATEYGGECKFHCEPHCLRETIEQKKLPTRSSLPTTILHHWRVCVKTNTSHTTYLVLNFRTLKRKSDTDSNSFIPVYLLRHFPTVSMSEPAKPRAMTLNTSATVMFPVVECLTIPYCSQRKCLSLVQHVQAQMSPKLPTSEGLLWRIVRNWLSMNVKQKWTKMNVPKQTKQTKNKLSKTEKWPKKASRMRGTWLVWAVEKKRIERYFYGLFSFLNKHFWDNAFREVKG